MSSFPLRATPGREARVPCGCRVVVAVERALSIDRDRGAVFEVGPPQLVVVPCGRGESHVALARALCAEGGMDAPEDLAEAMEEALRP